MSRAFLDKFAKYLDSDRAREISEANRGVASIANSPHSAKVEFTDRWILTDEFDEFELDLWVEDDAHVHIQFTPPRRGLAFDNFELIRQQSDRVFGKVFGKLARDGKISAEADMLGFRDGNPRCRQSDPDRKGMDLLYVKLYHLGELPLGEKKAVEAVQFLNRILCGTERPIERGEVGPVRVG